jgi:hypothetical protein
LGTPRIHPLVSYCHEEHPEVSWLRNVDADGNIDWYGVKRDLLIWDERATMHRGAGDYHPEERRIMLRTIVYPN